MRKTDVQLNHSSRSPPSSGPRPMPTEAMPAQTAMALPRSSRGKMFEMIDRVAGMMSAPPAPIRARTPMSWPGVSTSRTARLESPKRAVPACRARLRPNRSPNVPNESSRPAKTSK
jgi:hypothetical protein